MPGPLVAAPLLGGPDDPEGRGKSEFRQESGFAEPDPNAVSGRVDGERSMDQKVTAKNGI